MLFDRRQFAIHPDVTAEILLRAAAQALSPRRVAALAGTTAAAGCWPSARYCCSCSASPRSGCPTITICCICRPKSRIGKVGIDPDRRHERRELARVSYRDTPAEALALKAEYEKLPEVSMVVEAATLVPPDQDAKLAMLADIQRRLRHLPVRGKPIHHLHPNSEPVKR